MSGIFVSIKKAIGTLTATLAGSGGAGLVGFIQQGANAQKQTIQEELRARPVTPQQFFLAGASDWTVALTEMFATGKPWYIPYIPAGYQISAPLTIQADGICDGYLVPSVSMGSTFAVVIAESPYARKRVIQGLKVDGSVALRAVGLCGIRVDCANAHLINCSAYQLNYGIVIRMYSVTLTKCNAWQCNTNLSAYARDHSHEINALTIDGGNYDSAVNCAINIGDASWWDALPAGNYHGVVINIMGAVNTDGAESRIDNCGTVNINGTYAETTNTDCLWRLGGSGDGNLANINISGNFFKAAKYAIRCYSGVKNLTVGPNFLSAISISEVKLSNDIYGLNHRKGEYAGCFGNGQVVGLAFRSLPLSSVDFIGFTLESDHLYDGAYQSSVYPAKWYPTTVYKSVQTEARNMESFAGKGVYYTTPAVAKAGNVSGNVFTFTTKADSYAFNGGDVISTLPAGAAYVRSVDYDAGTALLDGGVTANGAATISQAAPYVVSSTYGSAAPTTGKWNKGDTCTNLFPAVGQPKGWTCTAGGTPGTWTTQGNL